MSTNFALTLSIEGIELLHRVSGGWKLVGKADVEDRNLDAILADLRAQAMALEPGGLVTKLVIPIDQVKYVAIDTTRTTDVDIHNALDGSTPYALQDLVIDCERRGGRTHIAAVARETLYEAEAFARAHRFNPVSFVAIPEPFTFQSEIFFGPTHMMQEVLGPDGVVDRDIIPILTVGTRLKSRLLVFDLPEEVIPETEESDLASLLAPFTEQADAPARAEQAQEAPAQTEGQAAEAAPLGAPAPEKKQRAEARPKRKSGSRARPKPRRKDKPVDAVVAPAPLNMVAVDPIIAETYIAPAPDAQPEQAPAPEPPAVTAAALPPIFIEENQDPGADAPVEAVSAPAYPSEEAAAVPVAFVLQEDTPTVVTARPDPAYAIAVDPIIAEYIPVDQRRARRRVIGRVARVQPPPSTAPVITPIGPAVPHIPRAIGIEEPRPPYKLIVTGLIAASIAAAGLFYWMQAKTPPALTAASDDVTQVVADAAPLSFTPQMLAGASLVPQDAPLSATAQVPLLPDTSSTYQGATIPAELAGLADPDVSPGPMQPPPVQAVPDVAPIQEDALSLATIGAPIVRGRVLSPDEAKQIYARTGVWQRAPRYATLPGAGRTDTVAWPAPIPAPAKVKQPEIVGFAVLAPDLDFLAPANPPAPEVTFDIDADGFVRATPQGAVTPDGAVVFAGLPDLNVRVRPDFSVSSDAPPTDIPVTSEDGLRVIFGPPPVTPPLRPASLAAAALAPTAGGVALTDLAQSDADQADGFIPSTEGLRPADPALAAVRPRLRPADIRTEVATNPLPSNPDITAVIAAIADDPVPSPFIDVTPSAIDASRRPDTRPRNFASVVANARAREAARQEAARVAAAAATAAAPAPTQRAAPAATQPAPAIRNPPTAPGGVARAATQTDAIRLRNINLIGVYGRPNARRALVRLGNGRYVRVEIGSSLDGGQVTAIGDDALNYVKRGRTYALEVPSG